MGLNRRSLIKLGSALLCVSLLETKQAVASILISLNEIKSLYFPNDPEFSRLKKVFNRLVKKK